MMEILQCYIGVNVVGQGHVCIVARRSAHAIKEVLTLTTHLWPPTGCFYCGRSVMSQDPPVPPPVATERFGRKCSAKIYYDDRGLKNAMEVSMELHDTPWWYART